MITRDRWGIATITGSSLPEVARDQGSACAEDRAWQLRVERLRTLGRCTELFGDAAAEWDMVAVRLDLAGVAQRAFAGLDDETRAFIAAYVDGVNAVLPVAEAWEEWMPLGVFATQHALFSSFPGKLWQRHLRSVVSTNAATAGVAAEDVDHWLGLFRVEGLPGGSNAVAVAGSLTQSGFPVIAGDPHRILEAPNCYAQVHLVCTDPDDPVDVTGFTFPGVPGVQHFARAQAPEGAVAWGITNAVADVEDVSLEDSLDSLVVRTPIRELDDLGFAVLLPLLRARSAADVVAAFGQWVNPVNNLLVADSTGAVEHQVVGRVPLRSADGGWTGWVDPLPARRGEVLVTANDRADESWSAIGDDFAAPHRARRIAQLVRDLAVAGPITPAGLGLVLADVHQSSGQVLLDIVDGLDPAGLSPAAARTREGLLGWDRMMLATSDEATLYAAVRARVVEAFAGAPLLAGVDGSPYGALFAGWFDLRGRIRLCLPALLAAGRDGRRPFGMDPMAAVRSAVEEVAQRPSRDPQTPATWGQTHVAWPLTPHEQFGLDAPVGSRPPAPRLDGDDDCVLAARSLDGTGACIQGPVARYVWDLAPSDESRWVVPLGAVGETTSPHHHDQQPAWAAGGTVRIANAPVLVRGDLAVRRLDPFVDGPTIHRWVSAQRAEFWGMTGLEAGRVTDIYAWIDAQPHLDTLVFEVGGTAVGLLQTYDPAVDEIGAFYDRHEGDLGVHLLLDDDPARRGRTAELVSVGVAVLAAQPGVRRLVLEPDVRNAASLALLDRLGATRGPEVHLRTSVSDKQAQFFFLDLARDRR